MKRVLGVGAVVLATWIFTVGSAAGSMRIGHREVAGGGSTSAHNKVTPRASASAVVDPGAITFDEFGLGTTITDDYADRGVVFTSDVFTTTDGSNPTAPVLSGTPRFYGDIAARFTVPGSTTPTTVDGFSFDVGFIDDRNSVEIQYFDASGALVGSTRAQSFGINRIDVAYRGVASFTVKAVEYEAAGFAIDNLTIHRGALGIQPLRMAEMGDSYSSGEGLVPEKGLRYDCGTDLHEGLYVEGTTQLSNPFAFWEKGSCADGNGLDGAPARSREARRRQVRESMSPTRSAPIPTKFANASVCSPPTASSLPAAAPGLSTSAPGRCRSLSIQIRRRMYMAGRRSSRTSKTLPRVGRPT